MPRCSHPLAAFCPVTARSSGMAPGDSRSALGGCETVYGGPTAGVVLQPAFGASRAVCRLFGLAGATTDRAAGPREGYKETVMQAWENDETASICSTVEAGHRNDRG